MRIPFLDHRKSSVVRIMQFWGGVPQSPNSKWQRILRIVQKCTEMGWESVIVFSEPPHSPELTAPFIDAGAEILFHQRPPGTLKLGALIKTYFFIRCHSCDLIHCQNRPAIPLLAAMIARVPVRIWSRLAMSSSYENSVELSGIHKLQLYNRLSCICSNKIICVSKPVLYELKKLNSYIDKKSIIIGGGVNLELYSSGDSKKIRNEFSISENVIVFTSVGHAVPVKGWDILLQAFAKFILIYPQSKLFLVGSTELDHEKGMFELIMELIESLSLKGNVIFTGKRKDIPDILAASDIYIQSSRSEGLCLALVEALAAGLPCIASNVGGTSDLIRGDENGLLFERENVDELTEKMLVLAQDPFLCNKLSSNAFPSVQRYGLEAMTNSTVSIYKELLMRQGDGKCESSRN